MSSLNLNTLQSEYIARRAEGLTPLAAMERMCAWRALTKKSLEGIPGVWPRAIVRELGRLGAELATLGATARMAAIAEVMGCES